MKKYEELLKNESFFEVDRFINIAEAYHEAKLSEFVGKDVEEYIHENKYSPDGEYFDTKTQKWCSDYVMDLEDVEYLLKINSQHMIDKAVKEFTKELDILIYNHDLEDDMKNGVREAIIESYTKKLMEER